MKELNIREAKTHLSRHLKDVERPKGPTEPRPGGLDKGKFNVGPEFFEPMPDDFLAYFRGER